MKPLAHALKLGGKAIIFIVMSAERFDWTYYGFGKVVSSGGGSR